MKQKDSKCQTCHAPIKWITLKGKPHPLNVDELYVSPNGSGKRIMLFQYDGTSVQGFLCKPNDHGAQGGCQSHFATCKNAKEWRDNPRRKRRAAEPVQQPTLF